MIEDTVKIVDEAIKDKIQVNLIINNRAGPVVPDRRRAVAADLRMPANAVSAFAVVIGLVHRFFNGSALREGAGTLGLVGIAEIGNQFVFKITLIKGAVSPDVEVTDEVVGFGNLRSHRVSPWKSRVLGRNLPVFER
jgi:hypothetical protein